MDETTLIAISGVAMAALFWIVTQWNVIRTKNILLKFSERSKSDANSLINNSFSRIEKDLMNIKQEIMSLMENSKPDLKYFESIPSGLSVLQKNLDELPDRINQAVAAQLEIAIPVIQQSIVESMDAKLKSMKAVEAHKLNAALREFGAQVDESTGEIEAGLAAQMATGADPVQLALMKMLSTPIPQKMQEENPLMAQILALGKAQAVQMYGQGATGKRVNTLGANDRSGIFG